MIKFINAYTGGEMWVHETRMDEYIAAGHKLAPPPEPPAPRKPRAAQSSAKKK